MTLDVSVINLQIKLINWFFKRGFNEGAKQSRKHYSVKRTKLREAKNNLKDNLTKMNDDNDKLKKQLDDQENKMRVINAQFTKISKKSKIEMENLKEENKRLMADNQRLNKQLSLYRDSPVFMLVLVNWWVKTILWFVSLTVWCSENTILKADVLSEQYRILCCAFKDRFGCGPIEYITNLFNRVMEVLSYVVCTDRKVKKC